MSPEKIMFWDRDGNPIEGVIDWAIKFEDSEYRVVAVDTDGPNLPMVSTIWQGIDLAHSLQPDPIPMTFETAYLVDGHVEYREFAASEEWAFENHRQFCLDRLGREPRPEDRLKETIVRVEREAQNDTDPSGAS